MPSFAAIKDVLIAFFGQQVFERHRKLVIEAVRQVSKQSDGTDLEGAANVTKMSGWLTKKGKKRWFELVGSDMQYFVGVDSEGAGKEFRGAITVSSDTVVSTKGRLLTIRNSDRVWNLTASSDEAASQWEFVLGELQPLIAANVVDWLHSYLKDATVSTFDFGALKTGLIEEFQDSTCVPSPANTCRMAIFVFPWVSLQSIVVKAHGHCPVYIVDTARIRVP